MHKIPRHPIVTAQEGPMDSSRTSRSGRCGGCNASTAGRGQRRRLHRSTFRGPEFCPGSFKDLGVVADDHAVPNQALHALGFRMDLPCTAARSGEVSPSRGFPGAQPDGRHGQCCRPPDRRSAAREGASPLRYRTANGGRRSDGICRFRVFLQDSFLSIVRHRQIPSDLGRVGRCRR